MKNIEKIIEAQIPPGIELLSINFNPRSNFIKIIIDSANEISVDKTALLANNIKNNEHIVSKFPEGIKLEVGTPGVGSKLEKLFQYEKNIGRNIELKFHLENNIVVKQYILINVDKTGIVVKDKNQENKIHFADIISAKVKISFD